MISKEEIFSIASETEFQELSLKIFKFQFQNNPVYRSFCDLLYKHPSDINHLSEIPFLPIQFYKSHKVVSSASEVQARFISSGTSGNQNSKHYVTDLELYRESFQTCFSHFYGNVEDLVILALLPNYLEREGSSLVYMVKHLIDGSLHSESGFYLRNLSELKNKLIDLDAKGQRILLIGVSFALLDLVELHQFELQNTIIMETGGMKGRRKELIREELHAILKTGFGVSRVHSEYGMTELLSQAYSLGDGRFKCPSWMRVLVREAEDPLNTTISNKSGGLNIIDLANLNSCSFIATQDLGKVYEDNSFEVAGRFDNSDIRGCNLMVL